MPWPLSTILFHEENEISRKYTCDVIQAIAFSMLNFKACGTPLNIMQSSKYFAQIFFIMIGTTSKDGTVKLVTFIFPHWLRATLIYTLHAGLRFQLVRLVGQLPSIAIFLRANQSCFP